MNTIYIKSGVIGVCVLLIIIGVILVSVANEIPGLVPQVILPYIIWFAGIIVFCFILPGKVGTVFD